MKQFIQETGLITVTAVSIALSGCQSAMNAIDAHTEALLRETSGGVGGDSLTPRFDSSGYTRGEALGFPGRDVEQPPTINPAAGELPFNRAQAREAPIDAEIEQVLRSLNSKGGDLEYAITLDLAAALTIAQRHSREYKTAEEEYILAALRLLIERHLWGPRFFDEISATITGDADNNDFDTALRLVNELRVTQRLAYGGEVSARLLARATEDLHRHVSGEKVQSADIILAANVPLLRGAGLAARESRIQAERDLIYAARRFERFRRQFLFDIARTFLNLVVQQKQIVNAENQLRRLIENLDRANDLVRAGRSDSFDAALAGQQLLFAQDRLASQHESYDFAVDRFKVTLGMPVDQPMVIVRSTLDLPAPAPDINEAVRLALTYRLDLQTRRDQLDDARRQIDIARNNILPDLDFSGSLTIPTDSQRARSGLRFNTEDTSFLAGVTFGLPLDREIERLQLRQVQINAARADRDYEEFRDNIVVVVRNSVREIERARFSLQIQDDNIRTAELRLESINRAPGRATSRDRAEAADGLTEAQDDRADAVRDLEVAVLQYLLNTGILRVNRDGGIEPLAGMNISRRNHGENQPPTDNNNERATG